jgi:glycosyltransferase involved in cell wall biosynthesis
MINEIRRSIVPDLPPPPPGRAGWPWDTAPSRATGEGAWPRVTVVTPSFNQGESLEETIRSVLLQGYPNLEYIIMDGGSSDESVDIIRKYEPWLAYWESEPDRGQSHAINKGFERATGEIVAWLNSDDFYYPGAVAAAVEAFASDPEAGFVNSDCSIVDTTSRVTGSIDLPQRSLPALIGDGNVIAQPTVFMRRSALTRVGPLREDLHMIMDYELWIRLLRVSTAHYLPRTRLAAFRMYPESKTVGSAHRAPPELLKVFNNLFNEPSLEPSLRAVRRRAYGRVYLTRAILDVERHRAFPSGLWWYAKSVVYRPRLALARPLAPLWFLRESARQTLPRMAWRTERQPNR